MSAKLRAFVAVAIVALVAIGICLWRRGPAPKTPLTAEMQAGLGAAVYVPHDVSAYASHMRLGPSLKAVWNSQAVQSLLALPLVQQLWTQMERPYGALVRATKTEPVLVQGVPILEDAVSSEVFACTGAEFPDFLAAMGELQGAVQSARFWGLLGGFAADSNSPVAGVIEFIADNAERVQAPSILLGFKLTKPDAARAFLDAWVPKIGPTPVGAFVRRPLRAGVAHVLEIHGETVFGAHLARLPRTLELQGIDDGTSRRFVKWLANLRASLAVGVFSDYLLLSVSRDTSLLERWGRGRALAESPGLEPLRSGFRPGLQSFSYSSAELAKVFAFTPGDLRRLAEAFTGEVPDAGTTKGLKRRVLKDVELLIKDIDWPQPSPSVACSYANKGIETLSFGGQPDAGLDYSQPLTLLAHRGKQPIFFSASRAAKNPPDAYDKLVKWLKIGFGYFQDFAVPAIPPDDRKHYDTIMGFVRPFLAELDDATRTCLIPSIDGAQQLFVLDGGGTLASFPDGTRPPKPIPIPRLAIATELTDPAKFVQAIERYTAAARKLIEDTRKAYPKQVPPWLAIPPPVVAETAAGRQVHYPLPWKLGQDVFPCALLKDRLLILASSSGLAREMAEPVAMPASQVTAPDKAAGSVAGADLVRAWDLFRGAADAILALILTDRQMRPEERNEAMLVKMHLDALWRSLGALRSYSSTTTLRDGCVVTHSWLHVEDIAK